MGRGYHRWDGHRYVWVHGYWAHPPHPGAVWVRHHWEQRGDGWVLVEGHWRVNRSQQRESGAQAPLFCTVDEELLSAFAASSSVT